MLLHFVVRIDDQRRDFPLQRRVGSRAVLVVVEAEAGGGAREDAEGHDVRLVLVERTVARIGGRVRAAVARRRRAPVALLLPRLAAAAGGAPRARADDRAAAALGLVLLDLSTQFAGGATAVFQVRRQNCAQSVG